MRTPASRLVCLTFAGSLLGACTSQTCSLEPGYQLVTSSLPAEDVVEETKESKKPAKLEIQLLAFTRGKTNDDQTSCAGYGEVAFSIDGFNRVENLGIRIELLDGAFPAEALPASAIAPLEEPDQQIIRLRWNDLPEGKRFTSPIKAILTVKQLNHDGVAGEAAYLRLNDPGGGV